MVLVEGENFLRGLPSRVLNFEGMENWQLISGGKNLISGRDGVIFDCEVEIIFFFVHGDTEFE